jgi:protein-disulfide isomerase
MKRKAAATEKVAKLVAPVNERDHIQGALDAPITLVEYGDYECSYCGEAYEIVKEIQERLGDQLCFAFRNFPLTDMHPHAEHAAEAAEAAGGQGRFWEMHDLLFENQEALDDEALLEYAAEAGLDISRWISDMEAGTYLARVQEDLKSGARSGVEGTPTFFINGVRHDGGYDLDSLLGALAQKAKVEGKA